MLLHSFVYPSLIHEKILSLYYIMFLNFFFKQHLKICIDYFHCFLLLLLALK